MKKIGVILADIQEFLPFAKYYASENIEETTVAGCKAVICTDGEKTVTAVQCGIGKVNAAAAAAALIHLCGVQVILNAGLSGAVSKVVREDIVVGTSYMECDFDLTAIGYELAQKPDGEPYIFAADEKLLSCALSVTAAQVKTGKLGTGDIFLTDKAKKQLYKEKFDITAFDMESGAIASVCNKNSVPFLSVRKISDDADDASAEAYREMNNRQEDILAKILKQITDRI